MSPGLKASLAAEGFGEHYLIKAINFRNGRCFLALFDRIGPI